MAFGQQSGPPASGRQLKDLAALLEQAGYASFRDARGPMGFTQRQGGGKFTSEEAAAFIEQLEAEADGTATDAEPEPPPQRQATKPVPKRPITSASAPPRSAAAIERSEARLAASAKALPTRILAGELERQGWILIPPEGYTPEP